MLTPFVLVCNSRRNNKVAKHRGPRRDNAPEPDPYRADQIRAWGEAFPRLAFTVAILAGASYSVLHGQAGPGLGLLLAAAYRVWPKQK